MKAQHVSQHSRIFKNPFLELFTRTSLLITMIHYPILIAGLVFLGYKTTYISISTMAIYYACGLVFWTLFEYIMHRYLFHISDHIAGTEKFQYAMHGVHHCNPRDEERVFMPPVPGLIIVAMIFGANYILMGWESSFFTAGMLTGYLIYAWIHYNVHLKPPHPMFRKLWKHHALHHYKYPDKAFGVSSPLWDVVFRTMPPKTTKKVIEQEYVHLN
jgi:4-hydroxysphinganine ceramide fatty acyl 2-hydroxylase